MEEEKVNRYVDIELSYKCEDQNEIDAVLRAINNFIAGNSKGLSTSRVNILGYHYKAESG